MCVVGYVCLSATVGVGLYVMYLPTTEIRSDWTRLIRPARYADMNTCVYIYIYIYAYVCACHIVCMSVYICVRVYVCVCICVYVRPCV